VPSWKNWETCNDLCCTHYFTEIPASKFHVLDQTLTKFYHANSIKFPAFRLQEKFMLLFCQNIFGSMTVRHIRNISDMKNLRSNEMIFCCSCYFTKIIGSRVRLFLTKQWNVLHDKDFKKISVLCLQKKYIFIFAKCNLTSPTEFQIHTLNIITSFSCFFCNKDFTL